MNTLEQTQVPTEEVDSGIPEHIKQAIREYCSTTTLTNIINQQQLKQNQQDDNDNKRDNEILIFNFVSSFIKEKFPNILINKTNEEKLNSIYISMKYFLKNLLNNKQKEDMVIKDFEEYIPHPKVQKERHSIMENIKHVLTLW